MMIPLTKPDVEYAEVAQDIEKIISSGRLTQGPYILEFEEAVADYIGVKHAVSTTSATTALHLSLIAGGIKPGDEVLVSDFTFPASVNAIIQTGAIPVLVDCLSGRFDLDVKDARRKASPNTKAIMPIDPFGQPADHNSIQELANDNGLLVVEDAACAMGSVYEGNNCGSLKDCGCFSFHPRKLISTGEGGMITTNDDTLAEKARILRSHGSVQAPVGQSFIENGFNYRLSEIAAALGLAQIRRIDGILSKRRELAELYIKHLSDLEGVSIPISVDLKACNFQSFVVKLDALIDRDLVIRHFAENGIETTLGTYAVHSHPAFSRFSGSPGDLPHSYMAQQQSLTLPLFDKMNKGLIATIADVFKTAISLCQRKH